MHNCVSDLMPQNCTVKFMVCVCVCVYINEFSHGKEREQQRSGMRTKYGEADTEETKWEEGREPRDRRKAREQGL